MNAKNLLIFQAVVGIGFGIALVFFPKSFLSNYVVDSTLINELSIGLAGIYGATNIGIGVGTWIARNDPQPTSWLWAILVACIIQIALDGISISTGAFNATLWTSIILVGLMGLWSAYLLFIKKSTNVSS